MARSLAATWAIAVAFFSLEVLRCFSSPGSRAVDYEFGHGRVGITPPRFPHSDILGSMPACGSPRLIAACHVLHRFPAPRHPPFALSSLTTNLFLVENIAWLHSRISVFGFQRSSRVGLAKILLYSRLVEMTGFEPATPCLQSRCSPN